MSSPALRDESHKDTMDYYGHDSHNCTDMLCIRVCTHIYFVNKNGKYLQKGADKIFQCKKHFLVYRFKMSGNLQRIHHKLPKAKRAEFENTQNCFMQT